jgi:hypothetical protein
MGGHGIGAAMAGRQQRDDDLSRLVTQERARPRINWSI